MACPCRACQHFNPQHYPYSLFIINFAAERELILTWNWKNTLTVDKENESYRNYKERVCPTAEEAAAARQRATAVAARGGEVSRGARTAH